MTENKSNTRMWFSIAVIVVEVLGIAAITMTTVWILKYRGGFSWQDDPGREFNYHPLFMVIGMIFMYGNAILVYRVFSSSNKRTIKILHAVLHILALGCASFALKAAFDSHNLVDPPIPNMYSLHSWMGMITVVLFGLQWVIGLITFLVPGLAPYIRVFYKPHHVFWGVLVFAFAIATALMGITEKNIFSNDDYSQKDAEGMLTNSLGLVLVAMGTIIAYIITRTNYRWAASTQAKVVPSRVQEKSEDDDL